MNITHSSTWKTIVKHLKKDRNDLLELLVARSNPQDTDILRGQIKQIDSIIESYPHEIAENDDDE